MKRSTLLVALMMMVAVLVPAAVANASHIASDGGTTTVTELSTAQELKAQMIAGYFAVEAGYVAGEGSDPDTAYEAAYDRVVELRTGEPAMGWGVLSKLALYAAAGMDIKGFLESAQDEDGGYSMGQLRKDYLEGNKDYLEGEEDGLYGAPLPKNFGQMQKAEKPAKADKKKPPGQKNKSKD